MGRFNFDMHGNWDSLKMPMAFGVVFNKNQLVKKMGLFFTCTFAFLKLIFLAVRLHPVIPG